MLNNPFQNPILNAEAQKFMANTKLPGFDNRIELLEDKTKERDPKSLCGSKHAVWVGIEPPAKPYEVIPFENNIVVAFWANDTSGGGILDPGAVIGGIGTMITDNKKYEKTVSSGLDIVNQNYQDCKASGSDDCTGEFWEAVGYTSVYIVTTPVRAVASLGSTVVGWFSAESYATDTDFFGMDYHSGAANAHTISIKITNEYEGVLRTVHDTTLAGTSEVYGSGNDPMPAVAYFTIDSPGVWRVRVKSKASGSCADPRLDINETFTVPTPAGWGQTDSPTESQNTPAASTEPIEITTQTSTTQVAQKTGVNPLALVGATIGVGGVLLYALLR